MSASDTYEVFAIRYATRQAQRRDHFVGGDPHNVEMPMDYFVWLIRNAERTVVVDTGSSAAFVKAHIPGALWLLRSRFQQDVARLPAAARVVVTCPDGRLSRHAVAPLRALLPPTTQVLWLVGGTQAWQAAGGAVENTETGVISERIDRYRRPYEGTNNPREAMQGYLDWEFGLVEQLGRDGTHGFHVI